MPRDSFIAWQCACCTWSTFVAWHCSISCAQNNARMAQRNAWTLLMYTDPQVKRTRLRTWVDTKGLYIVRRKDAHARLAQLRYASKMQAFYSSTRGTTGISRREMRHAAFRAGNVTQTPLCLLLCDGGMPGVLKRAFVQAHSTACAWEDRVLGFRVNVT
uniref:Tick transposon n=1 Tax=Rhipicephalus appendiculatus TaxID=34631 RepID=A0A131YFV9_RHIAP